MSYPKRMKIFHTVSNKYVNPALKTLISEGKPHVFQLFGISSEMITMISTGAFDRKGNEIFDQDWLKNKNGDTYRVEWDQYNLCYTLDGKQISSDILKKEWEVVKNK